MAGAIAAMDDQVFITKVFDSNKKVKDFTISELVIRGIKPSIPSANFCLFLIEKFGAKAYRI